MNNRVQMALDSLHSGEMSISRAASALSRRLRALPDHLAWKSSSDLKQENVARLDALRGIHNGKRCFIMGNGPSLKHMDLSVLSGEFTFGTNRIYLNFENMGFVPSYYVSTNELVVEQCAPDILNIPTTRFVNWNRRQLFTEGYSQPDLMYLWIRYNPHFATDLTRGMWDGATVTYVTMQVAYYLGFTQVILIGVDHNFETKGQPHKVVVSQGHDPNHFDPTYFGKGFRWQLPDLRTSEAAYHMAKNAFEADRREIVDATVGGKLQVFKKADFQQVISG